MRLTAIFFCFQAWIKYRRRLFKHSEAGLLQREELQRKLAVASSIFWQFEPTQQSPQLRNAILWSTRTHLKLLAKRPKPTLGHTHTPKLPIYSVLLFWTAVQPNTAHSGRNFQLCGHPISIEFERFWSNSNAFEWTRTLSNELERFWMNSNAFEWTGMLSNELKCFRMN